VTEERGHYRGIHSVLVDSAEFLALSPEAKLVFYTLRVCRENNLASIFVFHYECLPKRTGLPSMRVAHAFQELQDTQWIAYQYPIVWIRNGLRFDPQVNIKNPKHLAGVLKVVKGLPKLEIVVKFSSYYSLSYSPSIPMPIQDKDKEKEKDKEQEGVQGEPAAILNGWPSEWDTLKGRILTLPYFTNQPKRIAWIKDLEFWQTKDEKLAGAVKDLDALLLDAVDYLVRVDYKPISRKAFRQKLGNCLDKAAEFADAKAKRGIQV